MVFSFQFFLSKKPHISLKGLTPFEVLNGLNPDNENDLIKANLKSKKTEVLKERMQLIVLDVYEITSNMKNIVSHLYCGLLLSCSPVLFAPKVPLLFL
jgi:predicted  nucleic acid-binding Zn ribbon protein